MKEKDLREKLDSFGRTLDRIDSNLSRVDDKLNPPKKSFSEDVQHSLIWGSVILITAIVICITTLLN